MGNMSANSLGFAAYSFKLQTCNRKTSKYIYSCKDLILKFTGSQGKTHLNMKV